MLVGGTKTTCSQWQNNGCFYDCIPGYETFLSQYQLSCLGSIQPCCHHSAGNLSDTVTQLRNHRPIRYPFTPESRERERMPIQVKCLADGQRHTTAAETRTRDLSTKSHGPWPPRQDALHVLWGSCSDIWILMVVTARELVVISGFFKTVPPFIRSNASHERYTASSLEGREIHRHKPLLQRTSNPGRLRDRCETGARYCCAIASFLHNKEPCR